MGTVLRFGKSFGIIFGAVLVSQFEGLFRGVARTARYTRGRSLEHIDWWASIQMTLLLAMIWTLVTFIWTWANRPDPEPAEREEADEAGPTDRELVRRWMAERNRR